jgi:methionine-rich copper-binding protein CopC
LEQFESRRLLSISGNVLTEDIYPAGDRDEHYFSLTSQDLAAVGGEYVVTLSLSSGLSGFQPVAKMQAPSGNLIGSEIDAGSSRMFKLTVAGDYKVLVQDNDDQDTGTYVLALEGINPPSLDAQAITLGERKTARLDVVGEVDEYTFTATAGNLVTLSLSESHPGSRATLFSPAGDEVKLYSASTGNRVSQVTAGNKVLSEALEAGTYVIQVHDNNYTAIGDYQLSLEGLVPASADAVAITSGETKTGDIAAGEVDAYKFTATGGNVVSVSLSDVVSGTSSRLWAELYSPSGTKVAKLPGTNGPDEVENGNKVVYRLPAEAGTYVIQVYDYDYTHLEAYGVTLEGLNPASLDGVAIAFGQQQTGTLNLESEVDAFTFTVSVADLAAGGGQYLAELSLSSETTVDYKPRARLYSPSGETVGAELDSGDTKTLTLTQAGIHVIQVYDSDYTHTQAELISRGKAPEYTIHLQDAQPPFVRSVAVSDPLLSDLDAGPAKFAVTVVFSETMDPANLPTLVYGNSAVTGGLTPTLANPSVAWSASTVANDTLTVTYDVADRGLNAENVTIGVTGARDLAGNLQQGYSPESEFSIDTRNPIVSVFTPRDNATRVAPAANLVMTFGDPIQKGTGSILIKRSSDDSTVETIPIASAQVTVSGATATIDPAASLLESTGYYVEVSAGAVRDLAGNDSAGISGGAAWNFTTGDFTPPALVSLSPADEATGVAWEANLSLVFSEAVQPGIGQITIKRSSDGLTLETVSVPGSQVAVSGMTVTIDPAAALADNTSYFVEVSSGAIEDLAGNAFLGISGPSAWNFAAADVPPTVLALSPSDEAAGVVLEANLLITFNQPIRKGTGDIVIKRSSDDSTFQTISVQDALVNVSGPMATIHPATLLERREGYYVEIAGGAFEDLSGHPFAGISGPEGWDFTTVGPLVSDDAVTAREDTPANLDVLSNDSGLGRPVDPATLAIVAGPTHGTVAVHNGLVIYTPAANFSGDDTFRYTVRDVVGFESEAGMVTITVTEVPDYQNPDLPEDVNRSGVVTPLDVLAGINRINAYGSQLPPDPLPPDVPAYCYDVDGNNLLEPLDLLIIINYLNRTPLPGQGEGEGESVDGGTELLAATGAARSLPLPSWERAETDRGADGRQRIRPTSAHSDLAPRRRISPDRTGGNRFSSARSCRHDTALAALQQPTADVGGLALDEVLSLLAADWAQAEG